MQSQQMELLNLFDKTRIVIDTFVDSRSEIDKAAIGTFKQWTAKDLLANCAFWMEYMVERMEYYVRGEIPPHYVDFDALNQKTFEVNQDRVWAEVVNYAVHSLEKLNAEVRRFTDEQLNTNNVYGDITADYIGGPLSGEIRANGFIYPLQEIEKYYIRLGDQARATAVNNLLREVVGEPVKIVVDLITAQTLQNQLDAGHSPLIIDVRSPKEYAAGHIPEAVNIPVDALSKQLAALAQDRPIVTYCNMYHPGESRGEQAALLLSEKGYQAQTLAGGYPAWKDAGLPVEELLQT